MSRYEHDEEKRRAKREAARKKREAEARRLRRRLFLAVIALIVCGMVIYYRSQEVKQELNEFLPQETKPAQAETTRPTRPIEKDPITTIHIRAAGDLNVTDSVVNSGVYVGGFDFHKPLRDVGAILSSADLTVMNFEGNIYGEPYGTQNTSAPIELLQALRNYGVDLIQMANSCAINNGLNGLTATLIAIRSVGLEPVGAFANEQELKESKGYTITEVQGIKVAFVAFTKGLGGRGLPAGSENLVNLLYTDYATEYKEIDRDRITNILKNVETEKPDITIALLHWGREYNEDTSKTQNTIISLMQKQGVDVIIGTHPHVVQPIVFDESAGTLVAYSLGDFFGDAERGATNYSIVLDVEITKDANAGTTRVTGYSYEPIFTVKEGESHGNRERKVVRISKAMEAYDENFLDRITDSADAAMDKALTRIDERIAVMQEVECPSCGKAVTVYAITAPEKAGMLVSDAKCRCGEILPAGSNVKDYD